MAKWLNRLEFIVPACITFGPGGVLAGFESGLWLLIVGLLWLYLMVRIQRSEIASLTAQLAALQAGRRPADPGA